MECDENMDMKKAERCLIFVEHIEKHLKEAGLENVICKICGKTMHEIVKEETSKGIWIASGIYQEGTKYVDRNGKTFTLTQKITIS